LNLIINYPKMQFPKKSAVFKVALGKDVVFAAYVSQIQTFYFLQFVNVTELTN